MLDFLVMFLIIITPIVVIGTLGYLFISWLGDEE